MSVSSGVFSDMTKHGDSQEVDGDLHTQRMDWTGHRVSKAQRRNFIQMFTGDVHQIISR